MSSEDPSAIQKRLARLAVGDAEERFQCLIELAEHDAPLPEVVAHLDDPDPMVRVAAAQTRWQTSRDTAELPKLVRILIQGLVGDGDLPLMAGTLLVQMGAAVVPELTRQLDRQDAAAPLVVRVLGEIGGSQAIASLRPLVDHPRSEVAQEARQALDELNAEATADEGEEGALRSNPDAL